MKIELIKGDITKLNVDAIVNAANTSLMGGGGVDGAIHRAGGTQILEACRKIVATQGGCKVGEAVYTIAGSLPAKYVIHTVGPVWNGGRNNESEKLKNCYVNALQIAEDLNLQSIAFPNISTGVYKYPKDQAAVVVMETVKNFKPKSLNQLIFVCFDDANFILYGKLIKKTF